MRKILTTLLMSIFWLNLAYAGLFDAFTKDGIGSQEALKEQYLKERERMQEEKKARLERKRTQRAQAKDMSNRTFVPTTKKELIALLKKPKIPLQNIDVSQIKDMSYLFDSTYEREDLSGIESWDVRATKMSFMFSSPLIKELPKWYLDFILKHPTYMPQSREELERIISDDRVNLAEIDVSKIKDFSKLFYHSSRTLVGLEYWDMSSAENLNGMFELFGGEIVGDLSKWNLSNAKSMKNIFVGSNVESYPKWYVEFAKKHPTYQPKSKEELRKILKEYENVWVGSGKVGGVKVRYMALPLIEIDVSRIKDLSYVFCSSKRIERCVSRVEDFRGIEYWDVSRVENLNRAFMGSKINIDLKKWSVKNVKDFYEAFAETPFSQDVSDWEVSEGANVERVFFDSALEREDRLPKWAQ